MKQDKYIGMDVHQATTVVAVLDANGKVIWETIISTQAGEVIRLLESLSGPLHVTFEETTQAEWLYEVVRRHVGEVVVCDPRRNKLLSEGSKADKIDARRLAELLRVGMLRAVYHGQEGGTRKLKQLAAGYQTLCSDVQRTMARLKAIYRGRGIQTPGRAVYQAKQRQHWLGLLSDEGVRQRAAWLYEQLDQLQPLRRRARRAMLEESGKHRAVGLLRTIPQLGPIRSALIVAILDTPYRFRTRRQLWSYIGLAVVTHMSSEYEMQNGQVVRSRKPIATRGAESELQSDSEGRLHRRGDGRRPEGALSRLSAGIRRAGHAQRNGTADPGTEDRVDRVDDLEERRCVRSKETEWGDIAVSSGLPARRYCR